MRGLLVLGLLLAPLTAPAAAPFPSLRDTDGEPLPPGARLRLGTTRFRVAPAPRPYESLVLSADRKLMAVAASAGVVRVCSTATGKEVNRVGEREVRHYPAAVSSDGRLLATIRENGRVCVWRLDQRRVVFEVTPAKSETPWVPAASVAFPPGCKTVAVCDAASRLLVYDLDSKKMVRDERLFAWGHYLRAFSPDGTRLAIVTDAELVIAHEVAKESRVVLSGSAYRASVCWSLDNRRVALVEGGSSPRASVYDPATGKQLCRVGLKTFPRNYLKQTAALALSPDGKTLAVEQQGCVALFRVADGKPAGVVNTDGLGAPLALHFIGTDRLLVAGETGVVATFDLRTGKRQPQAEAPTGRAWSLAFSGDGTSLVGVGEDGILTAYDPRSGRLLHRLPLPGVVNEGKPGAVRVDRQGTLAVYGLPDEGDLIFVRLPPAAARPSWRYSFPSWGARLVPQPTPLSFAVSDDGEAFAVSDYGEVFAFRTGTQGQMLKARGSFVGRAAFAPNGRSLAVTRHGPKLHLIDLPSGRTQQTFAVPADDKIGWPAEVAFSPDGRLVAEITSERVTVWERLTGERLLTSRLPAGFVPQQARIAPGGRVLVAGSRWGKAESGKQPLGPAVWDALAGELVWSRRHLGHPTALALSADGRSLAVGQDDTSILIHNLPSRRPPRPTAAEARWLWADLLTADADRAWAAVRTLAAHPGVALPLLRERLKPAEGARRWRLIADLDAEDFFVRQAASKQLAAALAKGEPGLDDALRDVLLAPPSHEMRDRVGRLLKGRDLVPLAAGEALRSARAVAVLELIGGCDAVCLLKKLADGAPGLQTGEAKAALKRLRAEGR